MSLRLDIPPPSFNYYTTLGDFPSIYIKFLQEMHFNYYLLKAPMFQMMIKLTLSPENS